MTAYLTMPMLEQRISHTWKTMIQENIEGDEKRSAIFTWPRIKLDNKIQLVTDAKRSFINAHFFRDIYGFWGIPIISDKALLTSESAAAQKVLTIDETDYRHFYDGRECVLIDPDDWESYEVATIDTVDSSTQITVVDNLVSTWPIGTLVFPIYDCRIIDEQTIASKFRGINSIDIAATESFESTRSFSYTLPTIDTSVYPVYNTLNLFLNRPMNPITENYRDPYALFGSLGKQTPFSTYGDTRTIFDREFQSTSRKEIYDLLDFFDAKQGRYGTFYAPTWMNDIVISVGFDAADVILTTKKIYLTSGEIVGRHVYIEFPDKTYACREITARPSETSITIDSAIGTTIPTASLSHVNTSFLYQVRFNQDEIALDYQQKKNITRTKLGFNSSIITEETAWLGTWAKRRKITIDNTNIDSNLTHFPIPIVLGTSVGQSNQDVSDIFDELASDANRFKIAITKVDKITQIYGDIETWDDASEKAVIHVAKSDLNITSSSITELYLYFDSAQDDNTTYISDSGGTAAQSVWDSNFKAVYHMAQDPSGGAPQLLDSTSNNNDGTSAGSMASGDLVDGDIGKAIDFDGVDDRINISPSAEINDLASDAFTVEAIIHPRTVGESSTGRIAAKRHGAGGLLGGWLFFTDATASLGFITANSSSGVEANQRGANDAITLNTTQYVAVTYDDNDDRKGHIIVGTSEILYDTNIAASGTVGVDSGGFLTIGNQGGGGDDRTFDGWQGELRISDIIRPTAWIKATKYALTDDLIVFSATENL